MQKQIASIRKTRNYLLDAINALSADQFNKVPDGFNNNIAWNVGHIIAAQQGVCYRRADLPVVVGEDFFEMYKPGSRPERAVTTSEIAEIKQFLASTLERLELDYNKGIFTNYTPWTTRYGVEINNIEDAVSFLLYHEGLHAGIIMALKKLV